MEQERFKQLVGTLRSKLFAYAERLLGDTDEAEDVVQETLLKLWFMRDELDQYRSVEALAMQITKHLCLDRLKRSDRQNESLCDELPLSDGTTPYSRLEAKDNLQQVMRIIDHLPSLQQAILRMRHVEGLEIDEIANLTGSRPETVRVNLSRARQRVKSLFFQLK